MIVRAAVGSRGVDVKRQGCKGVAVNKLAEDEMPAGLTVGQRFGEWEIVGRALDRSGRRNHANIRARCSCGAEHDARVRDLKRGESTRCKSCALRAKESSAPALKQSAEGLGPVLTLALHIVAERGEVTSQVLADALDVPKFRVSSIVSNLSRRGLIERDPGKGVYRSKGG